MKGKIKKNIFVTIFFTIVLYVGLTFYSSIDIVVDSLQKFEWAYLPIILSVIYITFLLKFLKWQYYLSIIGIKIKLSTSFHIFMSSLTMSVTPGKIGELIKPYLIKENNGTAMSKTIPIVFAERVTEFFSLLLIVILGIKIFELDFRLIFLLLGVFIAMFYIVMNRRAQEYLVNKFEKYKFMKRFTNPIRISLNNSKTLFQVKPFLLMFLLSIVIWLVEAFGFYLVMVGFGISLPHFFSFFTYLFSVFAGSIAVIPAGLGITDGSITYLLGREGIPNDIAISAALISRITTLWFSLIVGSFHIAKFSNVNNIEEV